jgi:hypothetical protein
MASFTDAIHKFNPYIQQLPVDEMVKVGMYKQEKYDKGVEKIQSYVDSIAGMDVVRDVDKQYLQSKLNELGSNLKKVAGGDFSNNQLVNSVGGMAKQIIRDEGVQTAVNSTALYRKNLKEIEEDRKAGKENVNNTNKFNKDASPWLNGKAPGEALSASYFKPVDVWGKIKDIAKEVGVDESDIQQIYQTDANGNRIPEYNSKKELVGYKWNPIMVEKITKGKDPAKILDAFKNALTSSDYKQLAIDGEMNKAHYTPQMLKDEIIENTSGQLKQVDNNLLMLETELINENSKNTKDETTIASLTKQKEYYENLKSNLETSVSNSLAAVDRNPDAVRASLWTNSYLTSMSKELSGRSISEKYSVNPLFTVTMEQNKFNRQLQRDAIEDQKWQKDYNLKLQKELSDEEKYKLELFYKYGVKVPGLVIPETDNKNLLKEPIPTKDDPTYAKSQVIDEFNNKVTTLNETNKKLTIEYFKRIYRGASEEEINKHIFDAAKNNKESVDNESGDVNTFTARFAAKQLADWNVNPSNIPKEFKGLIAQQKNLMKEVNYDAINIQDHKAQALAEAKKKGLSVSSTDDILKNISNIQTTDANGAPMTIPKNDILDYAIAYQSSSDLEKTQINNRLALKYGKNFERFKNSLISITNPVVTGSPNTTPNVTRNPEFSKVQKLLENSKYKELSKIESEMYIKSGTVQQPVSQVITRTSDNKQLINSKISSILEQYKNDINETPGFVEKNLQTVLLSDDKGAIKVTTIPGVGTSPSKHILTITDSKTGGHASVTIDDDQYAYITGTRVPTGLQLPKTLQQLNFNKTTNMSMKHDDPASAFWGADEMPNLDKNLNYKVTADLIDDAGDPNLAWMKVYTWEWVNNARKLTGEYTLPTPYNKYNQDGTPNMMLDRLNQSITDAAIQSLKNIK